MQPRLASVECWDYRCTPQHHTDVIQHYSWLQYGVLAYYLSTPFADEENELTFGCLDIMAHLERKVFVEGRLQWSYFLGFVTVCYYTTH